MNFNKTEIKRRLLKYVINMACMYLLMRLLFQDGVKCTCTEIYVIALIGASVYAVLDIYIPAISFSK